MNQTGRVVSVTPQKTVISVIRESACGESCASCSAKCSLKNAEVIAETKPGIYPGDTVIFTDMDGVVHSYKADSVELLMPTDVDKVKDSGSDLILYTCTYSRTKRIVVRCSYAKAVS